MDTNVIKMLTTHYRPDSCKSTIEIRLSNHHYDSKSAGVFKEKEPVA